MFRIARRKFGETTYWNGRFWTRFHDEARCYKSRAAAKGVITRIWNAGLDGINVDLYVIGPDRIPPYL